MCCKLIKKLTNRVCFWTIPRLLEGFPSGQRDQTVNLTRKLRWFESTSLHQQVEQGGILQRLTANVDNKKSVLGLVIILVCSL